MDFLYEMIFLGLIETMKSKHVTRWIKLVIAILVSILFVSVFTVIAAYIVFGEDIHISERILYAIFMVIITSYYIHLIKGINQKIISNNRT